MSEPIPPGKPMPADYYMLAGQGYIRIGSVPPEVHSYEQMIELGFSDQQVREIPLGCPADFRGARRWFRFAR
jgi:hypothetical protein